MTIIRSYLPDDAQAAARQAESCSRELHDRIRRSIQHHRFGHRRPWSMQTACRSEAEFSNRRLIRSYCCVECPILARDLLRSGGVEMVRRIRRTPMPPEPLSIVLAEDDDGHATLIQLNLERAGLANGYV